jgi:hypothetical protein
MGMTEAEMTRALYDREMIRECLYRYCRGIDRADETALRGAYWPDGTDRHGPYQGSASGFIDWAMQMLASIERGIHQIHNILIDLEGDQARVESYFTALQRQPGSDGALAEVHMAGRYLDQFEKRDQVWRIADRLVVFDLVSETLAEPGDANAQFGRRQPAGGRWPDDPLYAFLNQSTPSEGREP